MKTKKIAVALLLLLLATVSVGFAATEIEKHPRIRKAFMALDSAIVELREAPHDFGGHKAEAIRACEAAKEQLRVALAYRAVADHP